MIDCDFIPQAYHERRRLRTAARLRVTCVLVLIMFMGLWWIVHRHRLSEAQAMLGEVALQKSQIDLVAAEKCTLEKEKAVLADRHRLMRQLSDRASLVILVSELSRLLSDRIVLTEFSLYDPLLSNYAEKEQGVGPALSLDGEPENGAPAPGLAPKARVRGLRIGGAAASLHDVLKLGAAIEANPLFGRVNLNTGSQTLWAGMHVQRFELACELVPQEIERP